MADERVPVVVAVPLSDDLLEMIAGVDDRIELIYEKRFFPGPRKIGDHHGYQQRTDDDRDDFYAMVARAEVLLGVPEMNPAGLRRAIEDGDRLRLLHAVQAGAGAIVTAADLSDDGLRRVTITTSAGVHAEPLADFSMLGVLAGSQQLSRLLEQQRERVWERIPVPQLRGATLLIVGLGEIGKAVAKRAKVFGMTVIGLKRTVEKVEGVDRVVSTDDLLEVLPEADHVVITLPGTAHTEGLIDAEALAAMKPGVVLVNVGRGTVIDEAALIESLCSGHVGFAALDVFEREPLPEDSPLWDLPNVLVSPHSATLDLGEERRVAELFADNLRRYLDGQPLRNVVDPEFGY